MRLRFNQTGSLLLFTTLLLFFTAACAERLGSLTTRQPSDERSAEQTPTPATINDQATLPPVDSTAQAALQAVVQTLQMTPTEGVVAASGGAPILTEGPSATITPASGSANTPVTVSGSGFPANVRVNVYLAGLVSASSASQAPQSYANTVTDSDGNYRLSFLMP
jgi:hypothetical protein